MDNLCKGLFLQGRCIDLCSGKHINVNHKVMNTFVELQPAITQRRLDEAAEVHRRQQEAIAKQQQELEKALEERTKSEESAVQAVTAEVAS